MKQIQDIHISLIHSNQPARVEIDGKNLIITGGNGCGKTCFLKQLYDGLNRISDVQARKSVQALSEELERANEGIQRGAQDQNYTYFKSRAENIKLELAKAQQVDIAMVDQDKFVQSYSDKLFVLSYYKAERQSKISVDDTKPSLHSLKTSEAAKPLTEHFGVLFEKYLVAQKVIYNDIIASKDDKAMPDALRIDAWLNKVQEDLRHLFEDDTLELAFNREKQSYYIHQINKKPFNFDELSSGFSAIMYIYTDLLMKVELKEIPANKLEGIVLIDEIDAHLHVSLQRRILSFFSYAFPNIQFIVTTHSPFVVQSVDNAIIYDLSKREQLEDLSAFSYQSILEGLLGVTVNSQSIEELLDDLDDAMHLGSPDHEKVSKLIERLDYDKENLSEEAYLFIKRAKRDFVREQLSSVAKCNNESNAKGK